MTEDSEYVAPLLIEYGDIEQLTEQTGPRKLDGNQGSGRNK